MVSNYNVQIANRCGMILAKSRAKAHLSRRELSEIIGISESTIKSWEAGQGSPYLTSIIDWFRATGENPFRPMVDLFWPNVFVDISTDSNYDDILSALKVYLQEVASVHEVRKLHYMVFSDRVGDWLGVLDMVYANIHTSLYNRYRIAEIIQTSYELSLSMNNISFPTDNIDRPLLLKSIQNAKLACDSKRSGYTVGQLCDENIGNIASNMLKRSRIDAGVTRAYIAKTMGKTERTIINWETVTEPSFLDICEWFHVLDIPVWPYMRSSLNPNEPVNFSENDIKLRDELIEHFDKSKQDEVMKLYFLIFGGHGSSWSSVLEEMFEHVHTPLFQRIISARAILIGYWVDESNSMLIDMKSPVSPNIDNLERNIELGTIAAKKGLNSYI